MAKHNPLPQSKGITKHPGYKLKKAKPQWVPPAEPKLILLAYRQEREYKAK